MSTEEKLLVKFTRPCLPYNPGDVAAFDPVLARKLVRDGVARMAAPPSPVPSPSLEPVHLGGGWYQVGDKKVKGKKAAYAAVTKPAQGVTK